MCSTSKATSFVLTSFDRTGISENYGFPLLPCLLEERVLEIILTIPPGKHGVFAHASILAVAFLCPLPPWGTAWCGEDWPGRGGVGIPEGLFFQLGGCDV